MFIRLVAGTEKDKLHQLHGVITEARLLRDKNLLYPYEVEIVNEIFEWLNDNLPCPPFDDSNWPNNAVSWFKDSSKLFISKVRDLIVILEEHGTNIRVIKVKDPGKIIYEDEYQVVATNRRY